MKALAIPAAAFAAGVAAWLIPASVHIVEWREAGPVRFALLAPQYALYWTVAAGVLAAALMWWAGQPSPATRLARAHLVAPLGALVLWLVPFLPWLPDRMPLLLLLAGPVRWLIAAAAVAAVVARLRRDAAGATRWRFFESAGPRTAFAVSLAVYLLAGWWTSTRAVVAGDEPHYLIVAHSLLADRDLKIENNHARRDYQAFFPGPLEPHYMARGIDGEIYSIHAPGLPLLILPAYAAAGSRGAIAVICVMAALAALAIFQAATIVGGRRLGWLIWAAVCVSVPFVPHAWAIYPEMAAAAIVAWAVVWLIESETPSAARWLLRGAVLAWLPWLHTKFSVLLAALAIALLVRLRGRVKESASLLLVPAVAGLAWLGFFYIFYGTFDPQAPYGDYPIDHVKVAHIPQSVAGLLFDQKFGLLPYAPVYLLAGWGLWIAARTPQWRSLALATAAVAAAFVLTSARLYMWWGGTSAPARFLVPVLPLLAPLIAIALASSRALRAYAVAFVLFGLVVAFAGVQYPERFVLFSDPHGTSRTAEWIDASGLLAEVLPTFTEPDWPAPLRTLAPWLAALAAAAIAGAVVRRRFRPGMFWTLTVNGTILLFVAGALSTVPEGAKSVAAARGRTAALHAFDPHGLRAFDYSRLSKASPEDWLRAASLTIEPDRDIPVDRSGVVSPVLSLPPGRYAVKVWFESAGPRDGDLQMLAGRRVLARQAGPLPSPSELSLDLPVALPGVRLQLTNHDAAASVTKIELVPLEVVPAPDRPDADVRVVEPIPVREQAYIAYIDYNSHPEGGVFWTRGTERTTVWVVPAGATQLELTVFTGPREGPVHLTVAGEERIIVGKAGEAHVAQFDLSSSARFVPLSVQATTSFRPVDVDPASADTRVLGTQVRVAVR